MGENVFGYFAAAGVRGGGMGVVECAEGERGRGYDVGAGARRSSVLVRDLSTVAEADVDLCGGA